MQCPQCQVPMAQGKPWEYDGKTFNREICSTCGHKGKAFVVKAQQTTHTPKPQPTTQPDKNIAFAMSYAKDIVVTHMTQGAAEGFNPVTKTIKYFRLIYKEMANPFSTKFQKDTPIPSEIDLDELDKAFPPEGTNEN